MQEVKKYPILKCQKCQAPELSYCLFLEYCRRKTRNSSETKLVFILSKWQNGENLERGIELHHISPSILLDCFLIELAILCCTLIYIPCFVHSQYKENH